MSALDSISRAIVRPFVRQRRQSFYGLDDIAGMFSLGGLAGLLSTTLHGEREQVEPTFVSYVIDAYLRNSVVFACLAVRARLFSEARFQFQQLRGGRPGQLFGTPGLNLLEHPEPGKTTGDLLTRAILDADLGGNAFNLAREDRVRRLRPDWMTLIFGSKIDRGLGGWDPDAEVIGLGYQPGGPGAGQDIISFGPDEIGHFAPTPDPIYRNLGISLLTAGIREIMADSAATAHKLAFFRNAATPNLVVKLPATMSQEDAQAWIELLEQDHKGTFNAYKTIYLGGGVDTTTVGLNFEQMEFKALQGAAETRIAALTGMHPVVAALSEGLAGSSLNTGNFGSAARLVGDATLRPLWRNVAGSWEVLVPPPPGSRLWYDDRDIAFLREDVKDQADIVQKNAATIGQLIKDGYTSASAIAAVSAGGDWSLLEHTGLVSVQLQPPGTSVPGSGMAPIQSPAAMRARGDFWPSSGPFASLGTVPRGTEYPADHALVRQFSSMFELAAETKVVISRAPERIITAGSVYATRQRLIAAGKDAGHASLARELNVSVSTVRRRLEEPIAAS